jgi:hypothetical protein
MEVEVGAAVGVGSVEGLGVVVGLGLWCGSELIVGALSTARAETGDGASGVSNLVP